MELERIIGINPNHHSGSVFYNRDEKLASELLYTQASTIVCYHNKNHKQRFLHHFSVGELERFYVSRNFAITISRRKTGKSDSETHLNYNEDLKQEEVWVEYCPITTTLPKIEGKKVKMRGKSFKMPTKEEDMLMTVWDLEVAYLTINVKLQLQSVSALSMSSDQTALCVAGKDIQGRDLIFVYAFQELVQQKKVELLGRQTVDFELKSLKFLQGMNATLIGCGKEIIRVFKLKNNCLPSQTINLNGAARGRVFNNSSAAININPDAKPSKVCQFVYVTSECGSLLLVNLLSRQVDKIIQVHNVSVQQLITNAKFNLTASKEGSVKLWSPDFKRQISEIQTDQQISDCDINLDLTEICILADDGTLSILEIDSSCFNVVMRSHQDEIVGICHNNIAKVLVSIGLDSSIKVWNCENLQQIHEFNTSEGDPPTKICSAYHNDTIVVGFKSGFIRSFNLQGDTKRTQFETILYESEVMDIQYTKSGKFMAVFYKNAKIIIFNSEKDLKPVKDIDYEFPCSENFSISFSPDDAYLANISSNASVITVWETRNFGLRWYIDLEGEELTKIIFAPNGHDLLVMTAASKLKYLRINSQQAEIETIREQACVTGPEPTDFLISSNNKYIICTGKEGNIRIYDYFMKGVDLPASKVGFEGHFEYASKICMQEDMKYVYSIGPGNGIYRWRFHGDREMPEDISLFFEESKKEEVKAQEPVVAQEHITYTEEQIIKLRKGVIEGREAFAPQKSLLINRPDQELLLDNGIALHRRQKINYTPAGYNFEQYKIELSKLLGCSIAPNVANNIVWDQAHHCFVYSLENILVFEELNQHKTQSLKQVFNNDVIHGIKLSGNKKLILAYTRVSKENGYPQIIVWETLTRREISKIVIEDAELRSVNFSNHSNTLLVVSYDSKSRSTITMWDFLEGHHDYLAKSVVPFEIRDAKWNSYLNNSLDEFVTISDNFYHYWRITQTLQMQYQAGRLPDIVEGKLTAVEFIEPMIDQNSVYMAIGLSTGHIWVLDTRTNSFLYTTKVLDCAIKNILSTATRLIVEGKTDNQVHFWDLKKETVDHKYDALNPIYFFGQTRKSVKLDGYPSASSYDNTAAEALFISTNNSIQFVNFVECISVKLKSCHNPTSQLTAIDLKLVSDEQNKDQDNQNYMVSSSATDGVIKIWSMYDLEHQVNLSVPKQQCTAIAMHQFKPFMVCAFTDGFLRFFDLDSAQNLGRCQVPQEQDREVDLISVITILPSGTQLMCATQHGKIILIHIEQWNPLQVTIQQLTDLKTPLFQFNVSYLEPYNKWLSAGSDGRILVYSRQDCNSFKQELFDVRNPPQFIFMDSFNIEEYVDNDFTETKRAHTLDHYYGITQRVLVHNEVSHENESQAYFLNNDVATYISFIRKCSCLLIRNFELHLVTRKIDLQDRVIQMSLSPGTAPFVYMILESNKIQMLDFVNEGNTCKIQTLHEEIKQLKVCPNGKYLLTSGTRGDVAIWNVIRVKS